MLDEELNPKISDFGMAKIFGSNEDEANTRRVTLLVLASSWLFKGISNGHDGQN